MRPRWGRRVFRGGVSAIELLVVFAILGVLVSLLLPAIQSAREQSRSVACRSRLKNIGLAVASYEGLHRSFPPGSSSLGSFAVALLPFLEQDSLYSVRLESVRTVGIVPTFLPGDDRSLAAFLCPSDPAPLMIGR